MMARRNPPTRPAAVAILFLMVAAGACTQRALIQVDVVSDTPFQNVTLRLSAAGTSKDFGGVSFTATMPFKAGIYVENTSETVTVDARALNGSNCIGIGVGSAAGVAAGAASASITIIVTHSTTCTAATGQGGSSGGLGGMVGGLGGNAGGLGGDSGGGTGGSISGAGGSTGGGVGGATGMGGQTGGGTNLITNGDFASGENSWGYPAMMGQVSHTATNGTLCVTLGANASLTIGYPSGGTPPFQINSGTSYRFSYQASVSANNTSLQAKVGQTNPPYDATGSDWPGEHVGTALQTITHTFTRGSTDSSMGVAFNLMGGPSTVCIDNVSLTAN